MELIVTYVRAACVCVLQVEADVGCKRAGNGNLEYWARQGTSLFCDDALYTGTGTSAVRFSM